MSDFFITSIELLKSYICKDYYRVHKDLCKCFPCNNSKSAHEKLCDILFRLEDGNLFVYSKSIGNFENLNKSVYKVTSVRKAKIDYVVGETMNFDLLSTPFKRVLSSSGKRSKKKIPLENLNDTNVINGWFKKVADQNGFEILESSFEHRSWLNTKERKNNILPTIQYCGLLKITDKSKFENALLNGIGMNKYCGFGMIIVNKFNEINTVG